MIITQIRKLCSCEELNYQAIVYETKIVDILAKFLSFSVDSEFVYGMKLEAYWTLTNLCVTDDKSLLHEILGYSSMSENILSAMDQDF